MTTPDQRAEELLAELRDANSDVRRFLRAYKTEDEDAAWADSPLLYCEVAQRLIKGGHISSGFALAQEGLARHRGERWLCYYAALALARMGDITKAQVFVGRLEMIGDGDQKLRIDTDSLAARLFKDLYLRVTPEKTGRLTAARKSAELYKTTYERTKDIFPGINAATMSLVASNESSARRIATEVLARAHEIRSREPDRFAKDYWLLATIAEAQLILGEMGDAMLYYDQAVSLARLSPGDLSSMRRNVQLLHEHVGIHRDLLGIFHIGALATFVCNLDDYSTPDGISTHHALRLTNSPRLQDYARNRIKQHLEEHNVSVAYCRPCAGLELIFADLAQRRGAEVHLVLPFHLDDFLQVGLLSRVPEARGWLDLFEDICKRPRVKLHFATTERFLADNILWEFADRYIRGLANTHAKSLGVDAWVFAATNGSHESGPEPVPAAHVVSLNELVAELTSGDAPPGSQFALPSRRLIASEHHRELKAMLFSDIKGFSHLQEEHSPEFFLKFTREVKAAVDEATRKPIFFNTWGDGLYAVFDSVEDAADFALRLLARIEKVNWEDLGMPRETSARIGLHVGPVYRFLDPVLGRENVFGSHVTRTARIEPVTVPGCVFVSEQFAALLACERPEAFVCQFVGQEQLAKGYDTCSLYWMGRR